MSVIASRPHQRNEQATAKLACARGRASAALSVLLALPLTAGAACQVELLELPVKMVGSRAVATVGINGTAVPLTVDSGAFFSFLTLAAATQLDLHLRPPPAIRVEGLTGGVDARMATVDKLKLWKGDIDRVDFLVGGNEPGAGTMGLMGRNLLSFTDTEYDLANGMIRFAFPNDDCAKANLAYWAGTSHVSEIELERDYDNPSRLPALLTKVKINGKELVAMYDTGATTILSARAARHAGVTEAEMTPAPTVYGAGRGAAKGWTAPVERIEIGDEAISHNRLHVADFSVRGVDLLIGVDFFLSHRIYVSKKQDKMFVTYNGGTVFALNRSGRPGAPVEADPAASGVEATDAAALARRAAALAARQDNERALAELNRAIELEPGAAAHFAQRAGVQLALKRPVAAMGDLDKALELDPAQADARLQRAALRSRAPDRDGARADLAALDKSLAPQANMRLGMARLYLQLEQPAQALAQLNPWLAAHPDEARRDVALNARCWTRALLNVELERALEDCDAAIDAQPKNAAYLDSRAWVHLRMANDKKALVDFDRSLGLRPGTAWSLFGRGLAKRRLGDDAGAEADIATSRKAQADIELKLTHAGLLPAPAAKP